MPQMKPINWLFLYLILNIMLIMMNIMNYYFLNFNIKNNNLKSKKKINNWKW